MSKCKCRNHKGTKKVLYKSQESALDSILSRYLRSGGGYYVRKCRYGAGWHVVSVKSSARK